MRNFDIKASGSPPTSAPAAIAASSIHNQPTRGGGTRALQPPLQDNGEEERWNEDDWDIDISDEDGDEEMGDRRPALHRPTDGRSAQPLLKDRSSDDHDRGRAGYTASPHIHNGALTAPPPTRPPFFNRRSTLRSRSPSSTAAMAARKKYTYAAIFLLLSLVSFTVQTETAVYIQHELGWDKAYCMLYLTHGSWTLLFPVQLLILRVRKWQMPWRVFWRRHVQLVRSTAQMVACQSLDVFPSSSSSGSYSGLAGGGGGGGGRGAKIASTRGASPWPYFLRMTAGVTCALTIAGGSWYVAVNLTSPSDLTAIYNCSAFFAYAFSVPLLHEKLRWDKSFSVLVAIVGVMVVAYGDSKAPSSATSAPSSPSGPAEGMGGDGGGTADGGGPEEFPNRLLGNITIGIGSVLYGLYEVLYKRLACPPEGCSPGRGMIFANTFGSMIGLFTLSVLWIPLPILHLTGIETFALPRGEAAYMLLISVLANATFSGSFLVLISLTSPVLSSVAALLTIFIVAVVDWVRTGEPLTKGAMVGGLLIVGAFALLSWSTWREMREEAEKADHDFAEDEDEDEEEEGEEEEVGGRGGGVVEEGSDKD